MDFDTLEYHLGESYSDIRSLADSFLSVIRYANKLSSAVVGERLRCASYEPELPVIRPSWTPHPSIPDWPHRSICWSHHPPHTPSQPRHMRSALVSSTNFRPLHLEESQRRTATTICGTSKHYVTHFAWKEYHLRQSIGSSFYFHWK